MKNLYLIFFLITIALMPIIISCVEPGTVDLIDTGKIEGKNIKIYSYWYAKGYNVKLAFIEDEINSVTYSVGKHEETVILVNSNENVKSVQTITGNIIMENDSMILIKKLKKY
jgi:hypothetical protein